MLQVTPFTAIYRLSHAYICTQFAVEDALFTDLVLAYSFELTWVLFSCVLLFALYSSLFTTKVPFPNYLSESSLTFAIWNLNDTLCLGVDEFDFSLYPYFWKPSLFSLNPLGRLRGAKCSPKLCLCLVFTPAAVLTLILTLKQLLWVVLMSLNWVNLCLCQIIGHLLLA